MKQQQKGMKIDLSDHRNPEQFLKEMQTRFPDPDIVLILEGESLYVKPSEGLSFRIVISAYEILTDQAKYAMYGAC